MHITHSIIIKFIKFKCYKIIYIFFFVGILYEKTRHQIIKYAWGIHIVLESQY